MPMKMNFQDLNLLAVHDDLDDFFGEPAALFSEVLGLFEAIPENERREIEEVMDFEELCMIDEDFQENNKKLKHDCMWAGTCASKDHPADEITKSLIAPLRIPALETPANKHTHSRSVLINKQPAAQQVSSAFMRSPESPPISDDEGKMKQSKNGSLPLLVDTIHEAEDLVHNELDRIYEENPKVLAARSATLHRFENDHSYYKESSWNNNSLGIDTPSDSEDSEIDVVNVGNEKQALPNNPTVRHRQQLQETVATAINNKTRGIRCVLPVRPQPAAAPEAPAARRATSQRGCKRKNNSPTHNAPAPKRRYGENNSSDSETDTSVTSDKRHVHNNLERQRRMELRDAYESLRQHIPNLDKKEKAAKVLILTESTKFIKALNEICMRQEREKSRLVEKFNRKKQYLSKLRSEFRQVRESRENQYY